MHLQLPISFILVVLTLLSHFSVCENEGDTQCFPIRLLAVNADLTNGNGNNSELHISFLTQESEVNIKAPSYNVITPHHFNISSVTKYSICWCSWRRFLIGHMPGLCHFSGYPAALGLGVTFQHPISSTRYSLHLS